MILKLFKRSHNTVVKPAILLCSIGKDDKLLRTSDKAIYHSHNNIIEFHAGSVSDFFDFIKNKTFDIVHLLVRVESGGTVEETSGFELFECLSNAGAKLVIFASGNASDGYIKLAPKARCRNINPMNVVMTLDRKGDLFQRFFQSLFDLMAAGDSMPAAWVKLIPQDGGKEHQNVPDTIVHAGLGQIGFVPR